MNKLEFVAETWKQAQKIAREKYEEVYGEGSWEDADKYEREDWVFAEFFKLEKEKNNMEMIRDSKGRFVGKANGNNAAKNAMKRYCEEIKEEFNNETNNNTTNNVKENDTMMNRTNVKENRMETLKANGVDTTNFFDLSMRIPFGAEVKIVVDGKEMVVPASPLPTAFRNRVGENGNNLTNQFVDICNMANDAIAQNIIENGYVKNSKLFRRWITAHTFRMLNYSDHNNLNRKGWEACMKDNYDYNYQFKMLLEEIRVLSILQKEDPEAFAERTRFFNGDIVVETLNDYFRRLKKYVKKQMREKPRTYRGKTYVKLARYGNVLVNDLDTKVYNPIRAEIDYVKEEVSTDDYYRIYVALKDFMNVCYNKLPYDTTKCAEWKDAFKGAGAFYTLQNLVRFHNVVLDGYSNKYDSERRLYELLNGEFKNEVWRFHNLLVDTIAYNNFDLKQSIANGHAAPNTTSERANAYRR